MPDRQKTPHKLRTSAAAASWLTPSGEARALGGRRLRLRHPQPSRLTPGFFGEAKGELQAANQDQRGHHGQELRTSSRFQMANGHAAGAETGLKQPPSSAPVLGWDTITLELPRPSDPHLGPRPRHPSRPRAYLTVRPGEAAAGACGWIKQQCLRTKGIQHGEGTVAHRRDRPPQ